jgi:hypothetical protein
MVICLGLLNDMQQEGLEPKFRFVGV